MNVNFHITTKYDYLAVVCKTYYNIKQLQGRTIPGTRKFTISKNEDLEFEVLVLTLVLLS